MAARCNDFPKSDQTPSQGLTWRALVLGLTGLAAISLATAPVELVQQSSSLTSSRLPVGVITLFCLWVALLNTFLRTISPCLAFTRSELLCAYLILLVPATLASSGYALQVFPVLTAPFYFATPANGWAEIFWSHLPRWLAPRDPDTIQAFYHGLPPGRALPWGDWALPLAFWTGFTLVLMGCYFCLTILLRPRWVEQEKLVFPLAQVPLEVVGAAARPTVRSDFFRNRVMWLGFAVPALLHSLNGLSYYLPAFPRLQLTEHRIGQVLVAAPWNAAAELQLGLYFAVIGAGFLVSAEVSFSFWFFYVLSLLQRIVLRICGLDVGPASLGSATALLRAEECGAFLALAGVYLWSILQAAWKQGAPPSSKPLSPRWAAWGFLAGSLALLSGLRLAGASWFAAGSLWAVWYVVVLGLTRIVSAGGLLFIECSFVAWDPLVYVWGTDVFSARDYTLTALPLRIYTFDQGPITPPFLMDAWKVVSVERLQARYVLAVVGLAVVCSVGLASWSTLHTIYTHGAITLHPGFMQEGAQWPFRRAASWITQPQPPSAPSIGGMIGGAVGAMMVWALQRRFLGWPLNPIGLLMASTWTLRCLWFSLFLAWLSKVMVLQWGGHRVYRTVRPFFVGLLLGELVTAGEWAVIDALTGLVGHRVMF